MHFIQLILFPKNMSVHATLIVLGTSSQIACLQIWPWHRYSEGYWRRPSLQIRIFEYKHTAVVPDDIVLFIFICVPIYEFVYDLIKGIQGFKTCTQADSLLCLLSSSDGWFDNPMWCLPLLEHKMRSLEDHSIWIWKSANQVSQEYVCSCGSDSFWNKFTDSSGHAHLIFHASWHRYLEP